MNHINFCIDDNSIDVNHGRYFVSMKYNELNVTLFL